MTHDLDDHTEQLDLLLCQIDEAVDIAVNYGGIEGSHHKNWVIDMMVRALTSKEYYQELRDLHGGDWDEGIAP